QEHTFAIIVIMEQGLTEAIDAFLNVDPDALSDDELDAALVAARKEASRLAAGIARLATAWTARGVWTRDGSRSSWSRFARDTGTSATTAQRELRRAEHLQSIPATGAALAEGSLSTDKADLLAKALEPGVEELFGAEEATLVDDIKRMRFAD